MTALSLLLSLPGDVGWLLIALVVIGGGALWVYTIVQIVRRTFKDEFTKFFWLFIVILFLVPGALFYHAWGPRSAKVSTVS